MLQKKRKKRDLSPNDPPWHQSKSSLIYYCFIGIDVETDFFCKVRTCVYISGNIYIYQYISQCGFSPNTELSPIRGLTCSLQGELKFKSV